MKDRLLTILTGVLALVAVGLVVGFFSTHQARDKEVEAGYHGLARINPFLAAERTLNALDGQAKTCFPPAPCGLSRGTRLTTARKPMQARRYASPPGYARYAASSHGEIRWYGVWMAMNASLCALHQPYGCMLILKHAGPPRHLKT